MDRAPREQVERALVAADAAEREGAPLRSFLGGTHWPAALAAEVRALWEELAEMKRIDNARMGELTRHVELRAAMRRVEALPAKWTSRARNARNSEARVRYDQAAFELEAALRPCASSEPDTAPISAPDGHSAEAVVLENPAKQRGKLL